ncbi:hypothetical protein [Brevibacillus sp. HD3.3A]|uniref:hypothetical protein n=1 Tax=Brevibacillus sp. HD3.3A TaxID=2738979 RepID=UPI00156BAEAD|nr:hypothetical protein [Brevibacillus sp. HD3.3A]UED70758.1 hypothetical protein HP435_09005 [Brevibacillus sp. HD3.3A]
MRDAEKDLALCEEATPGPWELEEESDDDEGLVIWRKVEEHPGRSEGVIVLNPECHYEEADINFIMEARTALPHWIQRATAAEAEVEQLKKHLNFLVTAVKTGYRAGYIDGDGFGDELMEEIKKITV